LFEVVAKAIYLLHFSLDRLRARLQFGLFQSCGAVVKMTQLRLQSFSWTWLQLRSFWFSWMWLRLLFVFTHWYV